jgi:hypothetical protein
MLDHDRVDFESQTQLKASGESILPISRSNDEFDSTMDLVTAYMFPTTL